jgi:hypothetical protein
MMQHFAHWRKKTATIYSYATTVDADGVPSDTATVVSSGVKIAYWIDQAIETNINDQFAGQVTGQAIVPTDLAITNKMTMTIDGTTHYVTGVNDIGGFGEIKLVSWRRENGS